MSGQTGQREYRLEDVFGGDMTDLGCRTSTLVILVLGFGGHKQLAWLPLRVLVFRFEFSFFGGKISSSCMTTEVFV